MLTDTHRQNETLHLGIGTYIFTYTSIGTTLVLTSHYSGGPKMESHPKCSTCTLGIDTYTFTYTSIGTTYTCTIIIDQTKGKKNKEK